MTKKQINEVYVERVTIFPRSAEEAALAQQHPTKQKTKKIGITVPIVSKDLVDSIWVAISKNTHEIVAKDKDRGVVEELVKGQGYVVAKVFNDWN